MKYFMLFAFLTLPGAIRASLGKGDICDQYRKWAVERCKPLRHRERVMERCKLLPLSASLKELMNGDTKYGRAWQACSAFKKLYNEHRVESNCYRAGMCNQEQYRYKVKSTAELLSEAEEEALKALDAVKGADVRTEGIGLMVTAQLCSLVK